MMRSLFSLAGVLLLLAAPICKTGQEAKGQEVILKAADISSKLLPETVFFRGQVAPTQLRNSGGVRFADDLYMLVALVDNSGYSTSVREKYQAYLLTEAPLDF